MTPLSLSDLERITGEDRRAIDHAIKRYGPPPADRAGTVRLWSADHLPAIEQAIATAKSARTRPPRKARLLLHRDHELQELCSVTFTDEHGRPIEAVSGGRRIRTLHDLEHNNGVIVLRFPDDATTESEADHG